MNNLSKHRQIKLEIELYGQVGGSSWGVFAFKSPVDNKVLRVIASSGFDWEHVSVSKVNKTPSWREMEYIKRLFFNPDEVCMQLHVAEADHISFSNHCLHIWRPMLTTIPLPPYYLVGPKANNRESTIQPERAIK